MRFWRVFVWQRKRTDLEESGEEETEDVTSVPYETKVQPDYDKYPTRLAT